MIERMRKNDRAFVNRTSGKTLRECVLSALARRTNGEIYYTQESDSLFEIHMEQDKKETNIKFSYNHLDSVCTAEFRNNIDSKFLTVY